MKQRNRQPKSLPTAAWDYRRRMFPGARREFPEGHYTTMIEVEEAFMAGARWGKRRASRDEAVQK